jgi:outer membrane protein TolC
VQRDVQLAYDDVASGERRIAGLEDEVSAAREALSQAEAGVRAGLVIRLEVLVAQDALDQAELALAQARLDREVAWLTLLRATGRPIAEMQ